MTEYKVVGPLRIPIDKKPGGRKIANSERFWNLHVQSAVKDKIGIYIYAIRSGKGIVPYYVGKTSKSFEKECFHFHKLDKYNDALLEYKKGRPIMFFIVRGVKPGQIKKSELNQIEKFLIQIASAKNPFLLNIQNMKKPKWSIKGVIRSGQGQPSTGAKAFKTMLSLNK